MEKQMEAKVDKRTKEYKAMIQNPEIVVEGQNQPTATGDIPIEVLAEVDKSCGDTVIHKYENGDPVIPVDFHQKESNPGFTVCSECGGPLEPNEDGTPKYRRQPEACWDCVHAQENKIKCKDGVIRDKDACKRVMRKNENDDEVWDWVAK
jgi:hypothetical protein